MNTILINAKFYSYTKFGEAILIKKITIINNDGVDKYIKPLKNFDSLPGVYIINEILIDYDLNLWFQVCGYDMRRGYYLEEYRKD